MFSLINNIVLNLLWLYLLLPSSLSLESPPISPTVLPPPNATTIDMPVIDSSDLNDAFTPIQTKSAVSSKNRVDFQDGDTEIPNNLSEAENRQLLLTEISPQGIDLSQNSIVFDRASQNIVEKYSLDKNQATYGLPNVPLNSSTEAKSAVEKCRTRYDVQCLDSFYRTQDGSCNNLLNSNWGQATNCYQRLVPADFADGQSLPRVSQSGTPLPNPRLLSQNLHFDENDPSNSYTLMLMEFGQLISHEINFTPGPSIQCCGVNNPSQCYAIAIPPNDPFFPKFNRTCIEFVRSTPCVTSSCSLGPRIQINQVTSYVDGSVIYGNSVNVTNSLRTLSNGLMKSQSSNVGELLPPSFNPANDRCSRPQTNQICFQAGDIRANQNPALTTLQTLFLRQHNRIARILKSLKPLETDENIFQESRRIVGAQMQVITWRDFLPIVVGPYAYNYYGLNLQTSGYTNYDANIDATLYTDFSTSAYRFGHSLIQNNFLEKFTNGTNANILLKDNFFYPFDLYTGAVEGLLSGGAGEPAQLFDEHKVDAVRNFLYKAREALFGLDLASLNIQRGRDHGIPGYITYVYGCNGVIINDFPDLGQFMTEDNWKLLQNNYQNVADIDAFSGILFETNVQNGVVGPTAACLIGYQFSRLKFGDRYYVEHGGQTGSFTKGQLNSIRYATSLASIICLNSDIQQIPVNVFLATSTISNPIASCDTAIDIDFEYWN